ncbi:MAG: hypothetical protein D6726_07600, partial [Nitrospirae bacterium]
MKVTWDAKAHHKGRKEEHATTLMSASNTRKRAELVRYLSRLPSHAIYNLAPPQYVKRGFGYYREGNLCNLEWVEDTLLAEVEGSFIYEVELRYSKGGLETGCNCPAYTPLTACKHVICALLSVRNILDPQAFQPSPFDNELRDHLLSILTMGIPSPKGKKKKGDSARLVFAPDEDDIYIRDSGDIPFHFDDISYILRNIRYELLYGKINKSDLLKTGSEFLLEYDGGEIPLIFKERTTIRPEIVFTATKSNLSAELRFVQKNNPPEKFILFKEQILIDPDSGYYYLLTGKKRAKIAFFFHNLYGSSGVRRFYQIPLKTGIKRDIALSLDDTEADIIRESRFMLRRKETELTKAEPEYTLNIITGKDSSTAGIELRIHTEGISLPFPFRLLEIINQIWLGGFRALRAGENRKRFFEDIVVMAGASRSDRKQIAARLLNHLKKGSNNINASTLSQYRSFVRNTVKYLDGEDYYFTCISTRWVLINTSIRRCLDILSGIYRHLRPGDVVDINPDESIIHIREEALYRTLGQMYELLTGMGVRMYYDSRNLRYGNWDITIDFRNEIDWFELRPEIKLNEKHLSEDELRKIACSLRGGIADTGGFIELLPEKVKEVLKLIYPKETGSAVRKREIHRIPRLQILQWLLLRKRGIKLRLPPEEEKTLESLLNFRGIRHVRLPAGFKGRLRRYQKEGFYWLCFLYRHRFGACLADDMGLGKTVQTIAFLAALKEKIFNNEQNAPHLIVVPPSLVFNWEAEIKRFYPSFRVLTYTGTDRKLEIKDKDIVITTYAIMRRDIRALEGIRFDVVVFDEAQSVKNIHAETTKAARKLNTRFKLALTGTPVENHIGEYFSIIDLCLPGLMGEYDEFMRMYRQQNRAFLDDVVRRTAPFVLRRTKEEILKELPGKIETDIYLDLTDKQKA